MIQIDPDIGIRIHYNKMPYNSVPLGIYVFNINPFHKTKNKSMWFKCRLVGAEWEQYGFLKETVCEINYKIEWLRKHFLDSYKQLNHGGPKFDLFYLYTRTRTNHGFVVKRFFKQQTNNFQKANWMYEKYYHVYLRNKMIIDPVVKPILDKPVKMKVIE